MAPEAQPPETTHQIILSNSIHLRSMERLEAHVAYIIAAALCGTYIPIHDAFGEEVAGRLHSH